MYIRETDLRKKAFDKLFRPQETTVEYNSLVHNYSMAIVGLLIIVINILP
jgi:hypothetical protein